VHTNSALNSLSIGTLSFFRGPVVHEKMEPVGNFPGWLLWVPVSTL